MSQDQRTPNSEPTSTGTLVARILLVTFVLAGIGGVIWYGTR